MLTKLKIVGASKEKNPGKLEEKELYIKWHFMCLIIGNVKCGEDLIKADNVINASISEVSVSYKVGSRVYWSDLGFSDGQSDPGLVHATKRLDNGWSWILTFYYNSSRDCTSPSDQNSGARQPSVAEEQSMVQCVSQAVKGREQVNQYYV